MNDGSGPVAGRLRRPAWRDPRLLVGLLLIAVSVVAVTLVVRGADQTTPYYAARGALTPGTVLGEDDVVVVSARIAGDAYVTADSEPWGRVVTRTVADGELLPSSALADGDSFDGRPVAIRTTLPLDGAIERGALVDIYVTIEDDDGRASTRQVGASLVVADVVREDSAFNVGGGETVYVVVPTDDIPDLLDALAADGDVSVVGLAGATA